MSNLKPLGKENPCPVCGRDDGGCRQSLDDIDFILCMTFSDARLREIINGYVCVKEYSGGGHETACFKPYEGDWTEQNSLEYQIRRLEEKRLQEKQRKQEKEQQQKRALGADERHRLYSEVLSELGVNDVTKQDLHQR